jgi:DNA-binding MarR family transcriptional regulator
MPDMPVDTLYNDTIRSFLGLHRYLRRYSRQIREEGISGRRMSALRLLLDSGPRTVGQLSDYLAVSVSTASEMVTRLSGLGYVARTRSEHDQRVVHVRLTNAGRDFALRAPLGGIPLLRERLRTLPPDELVAIRATFVQLNRLLGTGYDD